MSKRSYMIGEEEAEEEVETETAERMRNILEEKMQEAWAKPEARPMKRKLSEVARIHWRDQIMEALQTTKYAEELKSRAREINYSGKVKKVWK